MIDLNTCYDIVKLVTQSFSDAKNVDELIKERNEIEKDYNDLREFFNTICTFYSQIVFKHWLKKDMLRYNLLSERIILDSFDNITNEFNSKWIVIQSFPYLNNRLYRVVGEYVSKPRSRRLFESAAFSIIDTMNYLNEKIDSLTERINMAKSILDLKENLVKDLKEKWN